MCDHKTERAPVGIHWFDLQPLRWHETLREILLPVPWLVASLLLFATSLWPAGFLASFMFFLCALRLNHEAIHGNLGLKRWGDRLVMHGLSFLMGASNNAVAYGHMQHHKHAMGPNDFEGKCGHMTFWEVLRYGPRFPIDVNREAWRGSNADARKRIAIDWLLTFGMIGLAFWLGGFLLLHVIAMATAQCLTALLAVWITHQGTARAGVAARSQRGFLARAAYLMFYHREHHLYPRVPVSRLPVLAERLDRGVPGYAADRLPVVPWFDRADQ
ncbi:MAG: fatty acid desaturase [Pseudomonadota bacterium]